MDQYINRVVTEYKTDLYHRWKKAMTSEKDTYIILENQDSLLTEELFNTLILSITSKATEVLTQFLKAVLDRDWMLYYMTFSIQAFRKELLKIIVSKEQEAEKVVSVYDEVSKWSDLVMRHLVQVGTNAWNEQFLKQKQAVKELTAPMIPVFHEVCVLPLIGDISDERAETIKENLLDGIVHYHCQYVLVDITGVPIVDTYVSNYLMQATEAAKMLGSECIIVGIRPEIAQTLVNLGVNLNVKTFSNLFKGIEHVLNKSEK
ncbi:STAS domain-containing protein [Metabacillus iocasae]|uniref:RsbT co-antagonist protein RsbR n=1 Tax=Priestia iocasae TaxID=2291674 RepID=A0ABS2QVW9_9BACI|nr:STAS domain-containing protein [Metabacillus iocasae]MBM7703620.1 rsbT co-antagonist protein RsbR [Metabacillus iocasae]